MVVSTSVPWDAILNERKAEELRKMPQSARRIEMERHHVRMFHQTVWPDIKIRLHTVHGIEIPDGEEPHWVEPWRAAYWQPTKGGDGSLTWELTGGISADAASIARYLGKGWKFRNPGAAVAQSITPPAEEEVPVYVSDKVKAPKRERRQYLRRNGGS